MELVTLNVVKISRSADRSAFSSVHAPFILEKREFEQTHHTECHLVSEMKHGTIVYDNLRRRRYFRRELHYRWVVSREG